MGDYTRNQSNRIQQQVSESERLISLGSQSNWPIKINDSHFKMGHHSTLLKAVFKLENFIIGSLQELREEALQDLTDLTKKEYEELSKMVKTIKP